MTNLPILWSFRRCPYAMRARLALKSSGVSVELREIVLRNKPDEFLETSPSGTVPCLNNNGQVIDESFDVMIWALSQSDPFGLIVDYEQSSVLLDECDGPFKRALDRTKYHTRYEDCDPEIEREKANVFLRKLDDQLSGAQWLYGDEPRLADYAILPFVRQFANIDRVRFDSEGWNELGGWLDRFLESDIFGSIMTKYAPWVPGDEPIIFGP